jgi:hypothetical protein
MATLIMIHFQQPLLNCFGRRDNQGLAVHPYSFVCGVNGVRLFPFFHKFLLSLLLFSYLIVQSGEGNSAGHDLVWEDQHLVIVLLPFGVIWPS